MAVRYLLWINSTVRFQSCRAMRSGQNCSNCIMKAMSLFYMRRQMRLRRSTR